ncbi:hypothetical protein [Sciscionella marina]|uniref:hypothetical protein n=1 Tax=Sciscionella marina TaxID=508770 RepID=UPI00036600E8|nr:hypothetical protein [Sciscionella marina]
MTDTDVIKTLLAAARLTASDPELDAYATRYTPQRLSVDALYTVPEARYADPALRFRAHARTQDWTSGENGPAS